MEKLIILLLFLCCVWLIAKSIRLKRGIEELTAALKKEPSPRFRELSSASTKSELAELGQIALDAVAEAELNSASERSSREFLEALLNEIKDAIFILDENRDIRFVNEAARQLFASDQAYISRPFIDVCRDHRIFDTVELAEEIGSKVSDKLVLRTQPSPSARIREIAVLIEVEPLRSVDASERMGCWILIRDITNELETEQIRRDFVTNASHELRTPLSIINGYLEGMDDPATDLNQAAYRRAVQTMRKHGERISRIVEDMLTISKLENSHDLLNREPFDLHDSLVDMIDQLSPIIEQNRARVKIDPHEDLHWVLVGDRYYWDQIFFNLIENALKQNRTPGLSIRVSFSQEEGRYIIKIQDDGVGIPAADLPLVFKRFYRVQKHHAQNQIKGTGLGLSIVKRAVEAHQGTIQVESQPGVHTTFTISVPQTGIRLADRILRESDDESA